MENNFKGLYYNEQNDKHYYEGGAHFEYEALYTKLVRLANKLSKIRDEEDAPLIDISKKSMSRNKTLVKSHSQKQLKEKEENNNKCQPFINILNKGNETTTHNLHPYTKSEEININNGTIQIYSNTKQYDHHLLEKIPLNPKCGRQTRNNIKPGQCSNNLSIQYNKNIQPSNSTTSFLTNNLFMKQSSFNPKKSYCSLIKNNNNSAINAHRKKDALPAFENNNKELSFIKGNEEINNIFNINILPSHNLLNSNSNTIIMKPKSNFSFVNNLNNLPVAQKTRNKPNDLLYLSNSLKKNYTPLYKSRNEILLNNCKINDNMSLSKRRQVNNNIPNGYKAINFSSRANIQNQNYNNFMKKISQIQKAKRIEIILPGSDYHYNNNNNNNNDNDNEYQYQYQKQQSKDYKNRTHFIMNNVSLKQNSNLKRNYIPLPNKSPTYRLNNRRLDNKSIPKKIHIL